MEMWELVARERIRDSMALYNWSGDAYRLEDLTRAFTEDGELEVRGETPYKGRAAIMEFLGGIRGSGSSEDARDALKTAAAASGIKRIVRHNIANLRFVELTPTQAKVSCYFTVFTEIGLDHYGRYRDTFVPEGEQWLLRHRFVSTDWRAEGSTMASADSVK
ncbi:MAG TPA: nuclear transport factor 2 family protein [Frankiaceae bacterium]|jgi:hypothetical protein|nr:nuclear transport factor 2 family protein [Frankiaceae bacterium]